MTKMRSRDPGEPLFSAWVIRPVVWFAYQFTREARFLRKIRKMKGI